MKVVRVIESKRWEHKDGSKASVYGAVPWTGAPGNRKEDWTMKTVGWTWEMSNGTVGFGRPPAKTYAEAVEVMRKLNGE